MEAEEGVDEVGVASGSGSRSSNYSVNSSSSGMSGMSGNSEKNTFQVEWVVLLTLVDLW